MLARERFEKEYRGIFSDYKHGSTIWSPLAGGILTGKYNDGNIPEGSRFEKHKELDILLKMYFGDESKKKETLVKLNKIGEIAKKHGYS